MMKRMRRGLMMPPLGSDLVNSRARTTECHPVPDTAIATATGVPLSQIVVLEDEGHGKEG